MPAKKRGMSERFWEKVSKTDTCWYWTGACNRPANGYGVFGIGDSRANKKQEYAHRVSYRMHYGDIPPNAVVMHTCDNPRCVNPQHLTIGVQADNIRDMIDKGRHWTRNAPDANRGERNPGAKLTDGDVRNIRRLAASGIAFRDIRALYPLGKSPLYRVIRGESWTHVT